MESSSPWQWCISESGSFCRSFKEPAAWPAKWSPTLSGSDNEGMNRLEEVLGQFTLPELGRLLKRTVFASIGLGAVALIVAGVLGYIVFGLGVCIGLVLGVVNVRLIVQQAGRVSASQTPHRIRALASITMFRIGAMTALIVVLAVLAQPLGFGTLGGVAVFYFTFLGNLIVPLLKKGFVA